MKALLCHDYTVTNSKMVVLVLVLFLPRRSTDQIVRDILEIPM